MHFMSFVCLDATVAFCIVCVCVCVCVCACVVIIVLP